MNKKKRIFAFILFKQIIFILEKKIGEFKEININKLLIIKKNARDLGILFHEGAIIITSQLKNSAKILIFFY